LSLDSSELTSASSDPPYYPGLPGQSARVTYREPWEPWSVT